ncbi:patatin-like phospholipase family protein [Sphingomonas sp. LB-2]|uniref:patatin-like phospholipase family protein n=1 Tax=Sphingomonas caeni TaxID=2984949 RepID=UPI0022329E93|nr:patatin-like phospholipase family protein [Sphingomonas caeni]MCW3848905.1 patatin-like phospholipase family protein [Sphingomonas caeni]
MYRSGRIVAGGLLLIGASGCMHPRPAPVGACNYRAIPLSVDSGGLQPTQPTPEPDAMTSELRTVFQAQAASHDTAPAGSAATTPPEYLVLSGGSQHGAFGAGFFYGLPSVPSYDVVTGVSTGSLQATFLFLANQPVPKDRSYGWVDGPLADIIKPGTSNPGDLALAYSIAKEGDIVTPSKGGFLGGLAKGAMASFGPLRARLKAAISPDTLRLVAEQGAAPYNRKLFVGTVNLDDGRGYAIDLTELAARIDTPAWKGRTGELQDCYGDALIASSSVPPAAYPVTLEIQDGQGTRTNLYMDGGARFGVFLEPILAALGDKVAKDARVDVIVNGGLYGGNWTADGKPVTEWSSLTVAMRAVDILENQVYRFSVANTETYGLRHGGVRMAFISNQNLAPGAVDPNDYVFRGKSCAAWNVIDNLQKPLEFHPNYMACLSQYGTSRGAAQQWNWVRDRHAGQ